MPIQNLSNNFMGLRHKKTLMSRIRLTFLPLNSFSKPIFCLEDNKENAKPNGNIIILYSPAVIGFHNPSWVEDKGEALLSLFAFF